LTLARDEGNAVIFKNREILLGPENECICFTSITTTRDFSEIQRSILFIMIISDILLFGIEALRNNKYNCGVYKNSLCVMVICCARFVRVCCDDFIFFIWAILSWVPKVAPVYLGHNHFLWQSLKILLRFLCSCSTILDENNGHSPT